MISPIQWAELVYRRLTLSRWILFCSIAACCVLGRVAYGSEFSGSIGLEARIFTKEPFYDEQFDDDASVFTEVEYYTSWEENRQSLIFKPFLRVDKNDDERTHGDIRELMWMRADGSYVLKAGIGKVFWGTTEFYHLVDIINQTDLVEAPDGEEKLGQPMVSVETQKNWGSIKLFVLSERTILTS